MVACALTYWPYADIYSLAFILSAFAVACQRFDFLNVPSRIALASLAVCVSVGFYQTTIGVSCALLLMALAVDVLYGPDEKAPFVRFASGAISVLIGCALYIVVMKVTQSYVGVSLSGYRGASSISLGRALAMLPTSVPNAYSQFFDALFGHDVFGNRFLARPIAAGLICLSVLTAAFGIVRAKRPLAICVFIACVALLPMAALAICIIAPDAGSFVPLMVGGVIVALYFPAALASAAVRSENGFDKDEISLKDAPLSANALGAHMHGSFNPSKAVYVVSLVLACCLAWSYTLQSNCDSAVQYRLNNQDRNVATQIAADILTNAGYSASTKVAVIGKSTDGSYGMPGLASLASPYASWSLVWSQYALNGYAWSNIIKSQCGVSFSFVSGDEAKELAATSEFQQMPNYPDSSAIRMINGVLVVKVSDTSGWQ